MSTKYKSTRGAQTHMSFEEVVLGGLAHDKGLFVPETIPQFSKQKIESMRTMTYSELAYEVISSYVQEDQIPAEDLRDIINRSFSTFRTKEVTPLVKLEDFWVLELFHGPTFAFKDVALQFLGNVFEFFLKRGNIQKSITILGATSGDTGSAAIHGLRGKENVHCFIMYPLGKVTKIQERQMTTITDRNVHCINIEGDFDDCQAIVKQAFADVDFRDSIKLGAINSINWARVLAQITYYFYSWLRVTDSVVGPHKPALNFAVPTGNFGDILAGYYAKRMGLAVNKLVISTNQNDVLHRFFETGVYNKHPAVLTIAPSMDISISSNFERYLYYLAEESSRTLAAWMNTFESTGRLTLAPHLLKKAKEDFLSAKATEQEIVDTMKVLFLKENYLVCPHTATAVHAIKALNLNALSSVCLATAHPAKFEQAINMAIPPDEIPDRPEELSKLFRLPTRSFALENSLASVKNFIRTKLPGAKKQDWAALFTTVNMLLFTAAAVAAGIYLSRRAGNK